MNKQGMKAVITNFGAILISLFVILKNKISQSISNKKRIILMTNGVCKLNSEDELCYFYYYLSFSTLFLLFQVPMTSLTVDTVTKASISLS